VTNPEYNGYKLAMNKIFHEVKTWFKANLLTLKKKKKQKQKKNSSLTIFNSEP
jgi:hypothetical protein